MKDNQNNQLFTELTDEQSAVVEGGARLYIDTIFAVTARKQDDLYIRFNRDKIFGTKDIDSQETLNVKKGYTFFHNAGLELWDEDWGSDDRLYSKWITTEPTNGYQNLEVKGDGYEYHIKYKVT